MDYYEYTESFMSSMGRVDNACLGCKAEYPTMDRATVPADPWLIAKFSLILADFVWKSMSGNLSHDNQKRFAFCNFFNLRIILIPMSFLR